MKKNVHGCSAYHANLVARISWHVRRKMFGCFMDTFSPNEKTRVLDVGVMGNALAEEIEANYFEQLYPYPEMVTGDQIIGRSRLLLTDAPPLVPAVVAAVALLLIVVWLPSQVDTTPALVPAVS